MASATEPDWSREEIRGFWDPGRKLLRAIRNYQIARQRGTIFGSISSKYWVLSHWFWSIVTLGMPAAMYFGSKFLASRRQKQDELALLGSKAD
jgi:hypothetical protein